MKRFRFSYIRLMLLLPVLLAGTRLAAQVKETVCFDTNYGEGKTLFEQGERFQRMNEVSKAENSYNAAFDRFIAALGCLDIPENNDLAEQISKTKRAREQLLVLVLEQVKQAARAQKQAAQEAQMALDSLRKVQAKNDKIVAASFFYAGRFALAFNGEYYGYIDKDGQQTIPFRYDLATPFDRHSGFARVVRNDNKYLLDTLAREYRLAEALDQIDGQTQAVDLAGKNLAFFPDELYRCKDSLRILLLNDNRLTRLPGEMSAMSNLMWLDVRGNPLIGLPAELQHLPALKHVEPGGLPFGPFQLQNDPDTPLLALQRLPVRVYELSSPLNIEHLIQPNKGSTSYIDINSRLKVAVGTGQDLLDSIALQHEALRSVQRFYDLSAHTQSVFIAHSLVLTALDSQLAHSGSRENLAVWWPQLIAAVSADAAVRPYFNAVSRAFSDSLRSQDVRDRADFTLNNFQADLRNALRDKEDLLGAGWVDVQITAALSQKRNLLTPIAITDSAGAPLDRLRIVLLPGRARAELTQYERQAAQLQARALGLLERLKAQFPAGAAIPPDQPAAYLVAYLTELAQLSGSYARAASLLNTIPDFYIDLKSIKDRERLDNVVVRTSIAGPAATPGATTGWRAVLTRLWPHTVSKAFISMVNPYSLEKLGAPSLRFAPAFATLLKIDSRRSYFYNNYLNPGLGLCASIQDLDLNGKAEFGVGLVGTVFRDLLAFGWGWNFSINRPFYFIGASYPTSRSY